MPDVNGHSYAKENDVGIGTILIPDDGFDCMEEGVPLEVKSSDGELYVECKCGKHYLDGQLEEGDEYIGLYDS